MGQSLNVRVLLFSGFIRILKNGSIWHVSCTAHVSGQFSQVSNTWQISVHEWMEGRVSVAGNHVDTVGSL